MKKTRISAVFVAWLTGCASVVSNDGTTVVIDWDPGTARSAAAEAATKSCRQVGKDSARELADVAVYPSLPAFLTKRRITYRCE